MNSQNPGYKQPNKSTPTRKKRSANALIMVFLTIIIGITILCFVIMSIIKDANTPEANKGNTIIFHEANYDYNIFNDENYLILDRNVRFENSQNGITVEIVDGNLNDVPSDIRDSFSIINSFIEYAIAGESDKLNSLFSDEYIAAGGDIKMDFTMQQLYNIKITYITDTTTETNGYTYSSQDFWLEYMIRKNNGTFRNDMPSDCIKKEYVRITDRGGDLRIDVLSPFNTTYAEPQEIPASVITSIIISTLITVIAVVGVCIYINKKFSK